MGGINNSGVPSEFGPSPDGENDPYDSYDVASGIVLNMFGMLEIENSSEVSDKTSVGYKHTIYEGLSKLESDNIFDELPEGLREMSKSCDLSSVKEQVKLRLLDLMKYGEEIGMELLGQLNVKFSRRTEERLTKGLENTFIMDKTK